MSLLNYITSRSATSLPDDWSVNSNASPQLPLHMPTPQRPFQLIGPRPMPGHFLVESSRASSSSEFFNSSALSSARRQASIASVESPLGTSRNPSSQSPMLRQPHNRRLPPLPPLSLTPPLTLPRFVPSPVPAHRTRPEAAVDVQQAAPAQLKKPNGLFKTLRTAVKQYRNDRKTYRNARKAEREEASRRYHEEIQQRLRISEPSTDGAGGYSRDECHCFYHEEGGDYFYLRPDNKTFSSQY